MVTTGYFKHRFPIGLAMLLERAAGAIITVASLVICLWVYNTPLNEQYQVLMIIAALLALILLRRGGPAEMQVGNRFWSTAISVTGPWLMLFAVLLALGYATKLSAGYSRRVLFTWLFVTPSLIILTQIVVGLIILRITLSASNARSVVIAGAN